VERDEVYRRALRAAAAVTGRAGRRLAGVSLGICMAGAGATCLPNSGGGGSDEDGADGAPQDMGAAIGGAETGGAGGTGGTASGDDAAPRANDAIVLVEDAAPVAVDASPVAVDATPVAVDAASVALDMGPVEPDAALAGDLGPIVEDCRAQGGGVSHWRCCAASQWSRDVPGCSPCDQMQPPDTWAQCVACAPSGQPPGDQEEFMEFMACCESVGFDTTYGCTPWGPPAPPAFDGRTLAERLGERPGRV